jgi:hypothetical protein
MYTDFADSLWALLCTDDEAAARLLEPLGASEVVVPLVEGDLSVADAMAYARGLHELGLDAQARELLEAVLTAMAGCPAQGSQQPVMPVPMGAQGLYWS